MYHLFRDAHLHVLLLDQQHQKDRQLDELIDQYDALQLMDPQFLKVHHLYHLQYFYYSSIKTSETLDVVYDLTLESRGTPLHDISFDVEPSIRVKTVQESRHPTDPIYLQGEVFEVEMYNPLILKGCVLDTVTFVQYCFSFDE